MWKSYWSDKGISKPDYEGDSNVYALRFNNYLPKNKDAKILDIACGKANFCYYLNKQGYKNFKGIDISVESVEASQLIFPNRILRAEASNYLKPRIDEYDLIFMGNFLEHLDIEEIVKILNLCHKALKKRGILIIIVPNQSNPMGIISRYSDFTHKMGFTARSLRQVLNSVGFGKILIYPFSIDTSGLRWLRKIIFTLSKVFFGIATKYEYFYSKRIFSISIK